jgi:hypothetical protein
MQEKTGFAVFCLADVAGESEKTGIVRKPGG